MGSWTYAVGSLDALRAVLRGGPLELGADADVVIVPTAAAFTGTLEAALHTSAVFDDLDVRVEALMVSDRAAINDDYYLQRLATADLVVKAMGGRLPVDTYRSQGRGGRGIRGGETREGDFVELGMLGAYGVAMVFLPVEKHSRLQCEGVFETLNMITRMLLHKFLNDGVRK